MNSVNFNVVTPNVNYAKLKDDSTDKPTEQINFGCRFLKCGKNGAANEQAVRPGSLKKICRFIFRPLFNKHSSEEATRNHKVVDFTSDMANFYANARLGRIEIAKAYLERVRRALQRNYLADLYMKLANKLKSAFGKGGKNDK